MNKEEDFITYEEASILENLVKRYEEDLVKTKHELTKYKRAFNILKKKFDLYLITGKYEMGFDLDGYEERENDLGFTIEMYYGLTKEEYELLEELMKND